MHTDHPNRDATVRQKLIALRGKRDFDRLFQDGRRYRIGLLRAVVRQRQDEDPARVGFLVGLRVSKHAVVRNRIKRRLREAWRREMGRVGAGVDIAFLAQPGSDQATYQDLAETMRRVLRKARVIDDRLPGHSDRERTE